MHVEKQITYFKQYGAQRTGTNYLKRLIELNFEQVTVFGSVLGWKHGMYETGNGYNHTCDSHEQWIDKQTRDERVYSVDNHALRHTPEQLRQACDNLNYLISVKNPHAYVVSYKRFRAKKQPWRESQVKQWVQLYLRLYTQWRQLYDQQPDRCFMIDYDQLILRRDTVLQSIQTKFELVQKHDNFRDETRVVNASTDHGLIIARDSFNIKYYQDREYMNELPNNINSLITDMTNSHGCCRC